MYELLNINVGGNNLIGFVPACNTTSSVLFCCIIYYKNHNIVFDITNAVLDDLRLFRKFKLTRDLAHTRYSSQCHILRFDRSSDVSIAFLEKQPSATQVQSYALHKSSQIVGRNDWMARRYKTTGDRLVLHIQQHLELENRVHSSSTVLLNTKR